jgi:hypothetical protein
MSKLLDLVRDFRRQSSTAERTVTYEVVDPHGNSIVPCLHKGTTHYRICTGVSEPECDDQIA